MRYIERKRQTDRQTERGRERERGREKRTYYTGRKKKNKREGIITICT